jgi:ubiquinone/menaquinone biosynthesis C-methylase UbiE
LSSADYARSVAEQFGDATARRVEAIYLTPDVVAQREAVLARLALQPGERVLDVGSGPGLLAEQMALRVGADGAVVGVDTSDAMVEIARERCRLLPHASFERAGATGIPGPGGRFDVVVCTQVLEYVPDVAAALAEFARVLCPGGRLAVMDTDWTSCVWATADETRMRRVIEAWDGHCAHPRLPRVLKPMLEAAGFGSVGIDVVPLVNAGFDPDTYSARMVEVIGRFVTRSGRLPAEEVASWQADLAAMASSGRYFFSLNRYLFLGRRG